MSQVTVQHVNMDKVSCMLFKFTQFLYKAKSATVEKVGMMAEVNICSCLKLFFSCYKLVCTNLLTSKLTVNCFFLGKIKKKKSYNVT